jgi:release factor glutamine methyltransferase
MANSKTVFKEIQSQLVNIDPGEILAVAFAIMEKYYGLTLTDIHSEKEIERHDVSGTVARLNRHEPLQYVLAEAIFSGRKFKVNPSVLIPRPETEALIHEVLKHLRGGSCTPHILDIGTGSGCIAITLNLEIPKSKVYAIDISRDALDTAKENSKRLGAVVEFIESDFLNSPDQLTPLDVIVSNPPYVPEAEKKLMDKNVLNYEPPIALFVPDHDPLLFYDAIASKGKVLLKPSGKIFVEIHSNSGDQVKKLFENEGYLFASIIKDLDGKDRIVVAERES